MAFGVIFQNNVRALQRGRRGLPSSVIHGGGILMQRLRLKAEMARNLKAHFRAMSDVIVRDGVITATNRNIRLSL